TNFVESLVGGFMTSDARLFQEWRDWEFRRMSRTRSSTIKRARFPAWLRYIKGMIFLLSVRKRWIGGMLTLSRLFKRSIGRRTRNLQSRLQRKMIRQLTNAIQCHLPFEFWIATSALGGEFPI